MTIKEHKRRQEEHLKRVRQNQQPWLNPNIPQLVDQVTCLHLLCASCLGTGVKHDGTQCVHMISCPCPRCTPRNF